MNLFKKTFAFCGIVFCLITAKLHATSPLIHVIGDSHSLAFRNIESCRIHHIGAITMHRVGRDGLNLINLRQRGVKEGDIAVFAFGEIDVRCHIGKQRDLCNKDLEEVLEPLLINYLSALAENKALYKTVRVVAYSIPPPTNATFNPKFPFYGSLEDRIMITQKLNQKLISLASNFGIEILDVSDKYADESGALLREYSDGSVHITYQEPIKEKLFKLIKKSS